jgi:hypothetical protein
MRLCIEGLNAEHNNININNVLLGKISGSHGDEYKVRCFLVCCVVQSARDDEISKHL